MEEEEEEEEEENNDGNDYDDDDFTSKIKVIKECSLCFKKNKNEQKKKTGQLGVTRGKFLPKPPSPPPPKKKPI